MPRQLTDKASLKHPAELCRVLDGDTVKVKFSAGPFADGKLYNVRLLHIDTPEKRQTFGMRSKAYLQKLLGVVTPPRSGGRGVVSFRGDGATPQLRIASPGKGVYGRVLGVLYVAGLDINKKMVEDGYAWCYKTGAPKAYQNAMTTAKQRKLGLWADSAASSGDAPVLAPWLWRKQQKEKNAKNKAKTKVVVNAFDQIFTSKSNQELNITKNKPHPIRLIKVVDGDTIKAEFAEGPFADGRPHNVRLINIDTPEKRQAFGLASKAHLQALLSGGRGDTTTSRRTNLRVASNGTGVYGRVLGVIYAGRLNINKQMVADGHAWCYKTGAPATYKAAMRSAMQRKLGIWKAGRNVVEAPWLWRAHQKEMRASRPANPTRHNAFHEISSANTIRIESTFLEPPSPPAAPRNIPLSWLTIPKAMHRRTADFLKKHFVEKASNKLKTTLTTKKSPAEQHHQFVVYLGRYNLNQLLLKMGFAKCSAVNVPRAYKSAEAVAKKQLIGVWK